MTTCMGFMANILVKENQKNPQPFYVKIDKCDKQKSG